MTEVFYQGPRAVVFHGDCLSVLRDLDDNGVDSIVTDPPYGLGFMGKDWDDLPPGEEWARECLRVLKPGGYLVAFGGSRTWHRLAVAVEDAGFEVRDSIAWLYGSGFPKSLDVSKAIDKAAGHGRASDYVPNLGNAVFGTGMGGGRTTTSEPPVTEAAQRWQGWGTALKPAFEPIIVGRKPLAGTVAANVLEWGTGALNIDACRVEGPAGNGRWPTNVVLDESQAAELDQQTGITTSGVRTKPLGRGGIRSTQQGEAPAGPQYGDTGGASRFFPVFKYQAKAPASERPKDAVGKGHPTVKPLELMRWLVRLVTPPDGVVLEPFAGSGTTVEAALLEGFKCFAIEREADYLPLIKARIQRVPE